MVSHFHFYGHKAKKKAMLFAFDSLNTVPIGVLPVLVVVVVVGRHHHCGRGFV